MGYMAVSDDDDLDVLPGGRVFPFKCLRCQSILEADVRQCGLTGRCPTCGGIFEVPAVDPSTGLAMGDADPGEDGQFPTPMHAYASDGHNAPRIVRRPDDTPVIVCPRCQRESPITANGCSHCGVPFTLEGVQPVPTATTGSGWNVAALAFGLISLPLVCLSAGFVTGAMALVAGLLGQRTEDKSDRDLGSIGMVLGIIASVISLATLLAT